MLVGSRLTENFLNSKSNQLTDCFVLYIARGVFINSRNVQLYFLYTVYTTLMCFDDACISFVGLFQVSASVFNHYSLWKRKFLFTNWYINSRCFAKLLKRIGNNLRFRIFSFLSRFWHFRWIDNHFILLLSQVSHNDLQTINLHCWE